MAQKNSDSEDDVFDLFAGGACSFQDIVSSHCLESLYWHAHTIETLLPSGKRNPAAAIMLALLAEMARAERDTLRERILSGLEEAKRKGVKLGRPEGSTIEPAAFLKKHANIVRLLRSGQSVRNAAKISGNGASTVQRVKLVLAASGACRGSARSGTS